MRTKEPRLMFCGVRDGGDTWHIECRFDDGQKFAAVEVAIEFEQLAMDIAHFLNILATNHHAALSRSPDRPDA